MLAGLAVVAAGCGRGDGASTATDAAAAPAAPVSPAPPEAAQRSAARVFFSGHSLIDNPITNHVVAIAESLGTPVRWNEQIIIGSPIRHRTRGEEVNSTGWQGYSLGKNRDGTNMNVIAEMRNPQTISGERYDTLVIAERNDLIGSLRWEDTVPYLRHYHERLLESSAGGATYLYGAWMGVRDKNDPSDWIAYERAAASVWQCVTTRINHSLAAEGRSDRVAFLPSNAALADLVERATQSPGLQEITGSSVRQTMDRLFIDNVHVAGIGAYYAALVTYAGVFRRSPVNAWAPPDLSAAQARTLQTLAWNFVSDYYARQPSQTVDQCRALVTASFCAAYWTYQGQPQSGADCSAHFSRLSGDNPLYYDAATDRSYWYPAPP